MRLLTGIVVWDLYIGMSDKQIHLSTSTWQCKVKSKIKAFQRSLSLIKYHKGMNERIIKTKCKMISENRVTKMLPRWFSNPAWIRCKILTISDIPLIRFESQADHPEANRVPRKKGIWELLKTPLFKGEITINLCLSILYPRQKEVGWGTFCFIYYRTF